MNRHDLATSRSPAEQYGGDRVDRFGAVASSLCAVHCAVSGLLPAALGALGLGFLLGHEAEWVFTLIAVLFAGGALVLGWRRHRSRLVAGLLALGIVGLLASRGLEMSGGHHEPHHSTAEHADGHDEGDDELRGDHGEVPVVHEDSLHLVGTVAGVLAGLLLLFGHLLNIRTSRRSREQRHTFP